VEYDYKEKTRIGEKEGPWFLWGLGGVGGGGEGVGDPGFLCLSKFRPGPTALWGREKGRWGVLCEFGEGAERVKGKGKKDNGKGFWPVSDRSTVFPPADGDGEGGGKRLLLTLASSEVDGWALAPRGKAGTYLDSLLRKTGRAFLRFMKKGARKRRSLE